MRLLSYYIAVCIMVLVAFSAKAQTVDSLPEPSPVDTISLDVVDTTIVIADSSNIEQIDSASTEVIPEEEELPFIPEEEIVGLQLDTSSDDFVFKPQLSLGTGMLTFYGDIGSNNKGYHPMVSRLATTLRLVNPINDFLDIGFYVMFGQISSNERTLTRNLNFNSTITTGGITFNYNFDQLLKRGRIIEPYIHVGIESIEFLSKTDLTDANGNTYHYWSDGTIKDMPEDDPNADNAVDLIRDYTYESDIREQDLDGFGKYAERTFGIPLEIGANLHAGKKLKFRVGTAMHFTFSDLLDGVTANSVGNRAGDSRNDKMLFTHIAMSYDFNIKPKKSPVKDFKDEDFEKYFLEDTIDSDGDFVVDHMDRCANTPPGVLVDEYGCPIDGDIDGVPNTYDEELLSLEGAIVNEVGVTMTDDDHLLAFRKYKDSVGEFSIYDTTHRTWSSDPRSLKTIIDTDKIKPIGKKLFIVIGSDVEGVSANDLWARLANKDFQVKESGDSVMYVLGGYDEAELVDKINELKEDSIDIQGVVEISETNTITPVDVEEVIQNVQEDTVTNEEELVPVIDPETQEASFRIQIGAFSRKVSKQVFEGLPDVVSVKGDDGLYRFFSGSFTDKTKAASHKVNLSTTGYNDAFIVAFKNGSRITLREAGFEVDSNYKENLELSNKPSVNPIDPSLIKFRVQVGAFREKVPVDALDLFLDIGQVLPKRHIASGLTKYYVGELNTYQEAMSFREELVKKGLTDCFIVGEFKKNIISSQEALNLLGG